MNPDSTVAVTNTCPKDGVHLSIPVEVQIEIDLRQSHAREHVGVVIELHLVSDCTYHAREGVKPLLDLLEISVSHAKEHNPWVRWNPERWVSRFLGAKSCQQGFKHLYLTLKPKCLTLCVLQTPPSTVEHGSDVDDLVI